METVSNWRAWPWGETARRIPFRVRIASHPNEKESGYPDPSDRESEIRRQAVDVLKERLPGVLAYFADQEVRVEVADEKAKGSVVIFFAIVFGGVVAGNAALSAMKSLKDNYKFLEEVVEDVLRTHIGHLGVGPVSAHAFAVEQPKARMPVIALMLIAALGGCAFVVLSATGLKIFEKGNVATTEHWPGVGASQPWELSSEIRSLRGALQQIEERCGREAGYIANKLATFETRSLESLLERVEIKCDREVFRMADDLSSCRSRLRANGISTR